MIVQLQHDMGTVSVPTVKDETDAPLDFADHFDYSIPELAGAVDDSGIDTANTDVDRQDITVEQHIVVER